MPRLLLLALALLSLPAAARAATQPPGAAPSDTVRTAAPDTLHDAVADSMRIDAVLAWVRREDEARRAARPATGLRARVAALRASVASPAHLAVPRGAEGLLARQTEIVSGHFADAVQRGAWMLPLIERALAARGLPDELKYVAVIESALNPGATSSVGAAGVWQFMPETGAQYGLDAWSVRDPIRSTDAAVRFLADLGAAFDGDWQLAVAAYNCGPGRVARLAAAHRRRTGETATFWDIRSSLPAETRDYVVRFIAAAKYFGRQQPLDV